jgi:preprotein translocase subunit YajC
MNSLMGLMPILLMVAVFYFLMIRPENKKKKQLEAMRNAVKVGDNITTIGGIVGDVCHVKEDIIVIETGADRVRIEFCKWAISTNNTAQKEAEKARLAAAKERKEAAEAKKANKK